jgi:hypothetical protein
MDVFPLKEKYISENFKTSLFRKLTAGFFILFSSGFTTVLFTFSKNLQNGKH